MAQTYSQLIHRQVESSNTTGTLIALHGHQGGLDDLIPLAKSLKSEMRIAAPEAARGVFRGTTAISRTWFGGTLERPEPASFGDSLAQLERFIHDVQNRRENGDLRPWLLGYDQGSVLALSIALIAPDLISGVMAIAGGLPSFTRQDLLQPVASELPILLLGDETRRSHHSGWLETTAAQLSGLGNRVTTRWVDDAARLESPVGDELRRWLMERRKQ
jgi:phospholipase/carboxylesterase